MIRRHGELLEQRTSGQGTNRRLDSTLAYATGKLLPTTAGIEGTVSSAFGRCRAWILPSSASLLAISGGTDSSSRDQSLNTESIRCISLALLAPAEMRTLP